MYITATHFHNFIKGANVFIPDEMLCEVVVVGETPKLPAHNKRYGAKIANNGPRTAEEKAQFYFQEAMGSLALAKYWMGECETET